MKVFKTFFKVMKKFLPGMSIYFGIMVILIIMNSSAKDSSDKYSQASYTIYIENQDGSELADYLVQYLSSIHKVKKGTFSDEELKDMLYYQQIVCWITIPEGFGDAFMKDSAVKISSMKDEGQPWGMYVENQIESYLSSVRAYCSADYDLEEADHLTRTGLDTSGLVTMTKKKSGQNKLYTFYAFLPFIILSIVLVGVLPVVLAFRRTEVKARMDVSAMPATKRNLMLILSALGASLILWFIIMAVAGFVTGRALFTEKGMLFVLNSLVFLVVSVCMLAFLSNFRMTANAVSMISNIIGLSFSFLGGLFVPMEYLGESVKAVGRFLPTYWYIEALDRIDSGAGFFDAAGCMGIELLFGGVCLAVGLMLGKINFRRNV